MTATERTPGRRTDVDTAFRGGATYRSLGEQTLGPAEERSAADTAAPRTVAHEDLPCPSSPPLAPESVMTERHLAPLSALSTLARRPRPEVRVVAPAPPAPAGPGAPPARSRVVDNAVYSDGRRVATPDTAADSRAEVDLGGERLARLGLYRPEPQEPGELAELFDLPELAVEDAIKAHQRPKFERYGNTLIVVLKAAR